MEQIKTNLLNFITIKGVVITLVLLCSIGYVSYSFFITSNELSVTKNELNLTKSRSEEKIFVLEKYISELEMRLTQVKTENSGLFETLTTEQDKNTLFESQIQAISGTVGDLTKLSQTDKELLQKYSKVYFLNEHYVPENLITIDQKYIFEKNKVLQIHTNAYPNLIRMIEDATSTSPIQIISAFRSFGQQATLKSGYLVSYGSGANKFSADQGYSEHQLGTTVDLTTPKLGLGFTKFDTSTAYKWLTENAFKYGFTLSYPKQNTYFQYEPWHWRYVGIDLATRLHNNNQYFYDLPQREIDSYLISIF